MKTHIVSGSHRANSQSMKVAKYLTGVLQKRGETVTLTDLSHNALPLWDEGMWSGDEKWKPIWNPIAAQLKAADSLIIITPEYAGMAAPALKNFFLFCSGDLIAHKPALLVAVTSSLTNGAYPIQELRGSSYKNSHVVYIPDHVIVRDAEKILNEENHVSASDEFVRKRLNHGLAMLKEYEKALKTVRESGVMNLKEFPFGM